MINFIKKALKFIKKLITNPREAINSIKILRLVDVIFKPFDEAIMNAPEENYDRLGLDKKSPLGVKNWKVFVPLLVVVGLWFFDLVTTAILKLLAVVLLFYYLLKIISSLR